MKRAQPEFLGDARKRPQSPELVARRTAAAWRPLSERFAKHFTEDASGCWLWVGAVSQKGYGQLRRDSVNRVATHVALELDGRPMPMPGMMALHSCDTPRCVNPAHLRWGTAKENTADAMSRNRLKLHGLALSPTRLKALPQ